MIKQTWELDSALKLPYLYIIQGGGSIYYTNNVNVLCDEAKLSLNSIYKILFLNIC